MTVRRMNSVLWLGCAVSAVVGGAARLLTRQHPDDAITIWLSQANQPLFLIAYSFALYLWLKIAADHPAGSTMRMAWVLMAWSSAISIVRHGFEGTAFLAGWTQTMPATLLSLRQIPIVLSLVFLAAGLIAMWSSFAAIGLGLRFRGTDWLWFGLILAFVPVVFSGRENLLDAHSSYAVIRHFQAASPVLLAVPALVAVVLHRIRQEMGGGQLATSLRLMVAFLVLRLVALSFLGSAFHEHFRAIGALSQASGWAAPWLFPLAAVQRWKVTVSASALFQRYDTNPAREIAGLSETLTEEHAAGRLR
jgi:hypothetical protein